MDETSTRGSGRKRPVFAMIAALAAILIALAIIFGSRSKKPELTDHTRATGAPLTAEQRSVDFTHADLSFEVFPDRKEIAGRAKLTLAVQKPIERIQFDLDRNLPISRVAIGGQPLDA